MTRAAAEAAVRAAIVAFGQALERGDFAGAVEMLSEDAVFWSDAAPETRGKEPIRAAFARLAGFTVRARFDVEEVLVGGDLALVRGIEFFRLEPKAGGEAVVVDGRRAFSVWQRAADGVWRNTRGMTNWPAPPGAR